MKLTGIAAYVAEEKEMNPRVIPPEIKYLSFRGKLIEIQKCEDGLWRDELGCVYALTEDTATVDPINRCGVGIFSLKPTHPLTDACKAHDYAYSCPVYQLFHTREEADQMLEHHVELIGEGHWYDILAKPFYWITRVFGWLFWENKDTQ